MVVPSPGNRVTDVQATLRWSEDQKRDPERAANQVKNPVKL
jgi:hypothetical protein